MHIILIKTRATIELLQKKVQKLSHLTCDLQIHQMWIHSIAECGKYCKKLYIRCINVWSYQNDATDEWLPFRWSCSKFVRETVYQIWS